MARNLPRLSDYGVSPTRGFLSSESPRASFPDPYYAIWDELIAKLPDLISSRTLRREIHELPLLSTAKLCSDAERRRAYVVLGFLIQAYVWRSAEDGKPDENVPPQLSEPFLAVCDNLGMERALSYAGLCLWNWTKGQGDSADGGGDDAFELDDLRPLVSFTGTRDEAAFTLVPVVIEADGGHLVSSLIEAVAAIERGDADSVANVLVDASKILARLNGHLRKLYATVDVATFHTQLRPLLAGGKGMEHRGLPRGMVFQRNDGAETAVKLAGGSAVQSSLFPFLDQLLGVEHSGSSAELLKESRGHMPAKHRQFLNDVARLLTIRNFVSSNHSNEILVAAFDECTRQLKSWRGQHIAVVSKYIIQPDRLSRAGSQENGVAGGESQGTGGADILPFLRELKGDVSGIQALLG